MLEIRKMGSAYVEWHGIDRSFLLSCMEKSAYERPAVPASP